MQKKFSDALRERIRQSDLSPDELTAAIGRTRSALYSWLARNTFDRELIRGLCLAVGWDITPDQIEEEFHVIWTTRRRRLSRRGKGLMGRFRAIDSELANVSRRMSRLEQMTKGLFQAMGKDDFYIFTSCTVESSIVRVRLQGSLAKNAAEALERGATFLLISPNEEWTRSFTNPADWGFRSGIMQSHEFAASFDRFRSFVRERLMAMHMSESEIEEILYGRLDQYQISSFPMWMPGIAVSMFGTSEEDLDSRVRLSITLPRDRHGSDIPFAKNAIFEQRMVRSTRITISKERAKMEGLMKQVNGDERQKLILRASLAKRMESILQKIDLPYESSIDHH